MVLYKSLSNGSLTAEFQKHFSNELAPVLLDVCNSWGKLRTTGVTSRTGIALVKYKKGYKKDVTNYRHILQLLPYTVILRNQLQKQFTYYNRRTPVRSY